MSGSSGSYNAVNWLLDRNVDEGRADKLAFTDTVSELSYGELQKQSCRLAHLLRRLGVGRGESGGSVNLDTRGFSVLVSRRHPRRRGAGAAQYAADLGSIRLCAGGLPRPGAVHLGSAVAGGERHAGADGGSRSRHRRRQRARLQETLR